MGENGKLASEQLKQYYDEGYVILEDFFGVQEIDPLREHIDVFDAELNQQLVAAGGGGFVQIPNQIVFTANLNLRDPVIQAFTAQPKLVDLTTQLLGPDVRLYWDQSVYKRPEAKRDFPWHQDNGYVPTDPVHYVTVWIALEDATIQNGCVWILPRTHAQGVVEHKKTDIGWQCYFGDDPGIPVELRKGGMAVFQSTLFHRSGPNLSQGMRKGYIAQYSVDGARNPTTGVVFDNGPVIARGGKPAYSGFYQRGKWPVRIYIIGAGAIARYHAAAVARLPESDGVPLSVADPNADTLAEFQRQFPAAHGFSDARDMLAAPAEAGDIVVVATPPFTHRELVCMALETGRHTLCEKPLAMSRDEAHQMLQTARAHDCLLGCCSSRFLGLPTSAEVKRLIRSGALGRLYHVTFVNRDRCTRAGIEYQPGSRWFLDRSKNGGGIIMDWGPYDFSALNDILQPVRVDVLSAWMANPATARDPDDVVFDVDEHGGASLRYHLADGTTLQVTYERSACTYGEERSVVEIEGLRGAVTWDWLMAERPGRVTYTFDNGDCFERRTSTFDDPDALDLHDKPLVYFYQRTRGSDSPAVVNEQAVFNFSCFRAMYDYIEKGQTQVVAGR
ncbi:MAG: phytanoyl-CoA dioxygenase family protein [Chloroflexi bacterium]|nr:phytanoyl-CoA dioxygenase family protein [Chloroflexota bacterium]